jgi:hypothetical protein
MSDQLTVGELREVLSEANDDDIVYLISQGAIDDAIHAEAGTTEWNNGKVEQSVEIAGRGM